MKKALVVGGSNGMGLALSKLLCDRGDQVVIFDRMKPEEGVLPEGGYLYEKCDLLFLNPDQFQPWIEDPELKTLFVTAGFGKVADLEDHHIAEIENMLRVNAVSTLKILRLFYDRIKGDEPFFAGLMGSISGLISSPMTAVYAASKAAVCRFVESVNIELEVKGSENRILNVSPGSFRGSRFYGGKNDLSQLLPLAGEILEQLYARQTLYIPDYEKTFKGVIARYQADPHAFGLSSYTYKQESGRGEKARKVCIGYLSGTFDLFHVGHLNLLRRAKEQCDYLIVGVHSSGAWKKKETFIPFEERKQIVAACRYVDKVVQSCPEDSDAWALWHYDKLFVGSDYKGTERFNRYAEYFKDKGVEIVFFPYTTSTSSTQIRNAIKNDKKTEE